MLGDMTVIQGAISSLKTATELVLGLAKLKNATEIAVATTTLQLKLAEISKALAAAEANQAAMAQRIRELETKLVRSEAWSAQKERYQLYSPWSGATVYATKESMSGGEPAHWLCPTCYDRDQRSILQLVEGKKFQDLSRFVCYTCRLSVPTPYRGAVNVRWVPE